MVLGMDIANGEDFSVNIAVTGDSSSLLEEPEDMGNLVCMHYSFRR